MNWLTIGIAKEDEEMWKKTKNKEIQKQALEGMRKRNAKITVEKSKNKSKDKKKLLNDRKELKATKEIKTLLMRKSKENKFTNDGLRLNEIT